MRISDWSSDVCSSDLTHHLPGRDCARGSRRTRLHPLDLALRPVAGHGGIRGRHRHLLRPPTDCRAPATGLIALAGGDRASLGPVATGLGEIFMYTVASEPGATDSDGRPWTLTSLRTDRKSTRLNSSH